MKIFLITLLTQIIFAKPLFAEASKSEFEQTLESARKYFRPIYQSHGKELSILGEWDYDENNAKALAYTVDHYFIEIYGGALKSEGTNTDSLRAMICHEVGHHLGGAPFMPQYYEDYYLFQGSSEGQADYYAANVCLKKWLNGEDHWRKIHQIGFSKKDQIFCERYHNDKNNIGLCIRIITAFKRMLSLKIESEVQINLKTPSLAYKYALASSVTHPPSLCRLETAYAGVICHQENGCSIFQNPIEASRPLCWAGVGFLLENEYKSAPQKTIEFINKLKIKNFFKDPYDDDEVHEKSLQLKSKFQNVIPALDNYN